MVDPQRLTHLDAEGRARMVDVGGKPVSMRTARARARVRMSEDAVRAVAGDQVAKGDVGAVARVGGIQGAKRASELIALSHPLSIDRVAVHVEVDLDANEVVLTAEVGATGRTGVEMEALTAATVAALNVWDMVKGLDADLEIAEVVLIEKRKELLPPTG